jgi:histone H2A
MAAALEYLCADLMDIAGSITRDRRKKRITPRHILYAIKDDRELDELLRDVHVPEGGTRPWLHIALLPAFRPGRGGPASQRWAFQALSHDDNRR